MRTGPPARQAARGLILKTFAIPIPCERPEEIVDPYRLNLSIRTRLILVSHVIDITGQILPVREIDRFRAAMEEVLAKGLPA